VRVELYATARAAVGARELRLEVPAGGLSARAFVAALGARYPPLAPILRHSRLVRGDEYLSGYGQRIRPGDRLSVHPPYGGG
jgi:molybdopterin converting factor small subunit